MKISIKRIDEVAFIRKVKEFVNRILSGISNKILIDILAYQDYIWLMNRPEMIITDSGVIIKLAFLKINN